MNKLVLNSNDQVIMNPVHVNLLNQPTIRDLFKCLTKINVYNIHLPTFVNLLHHLPTFIDLLHHLVKVKFYQFFTFITVHSITNSGVICKLTNNATYILKQIISKANFVFNLLSQLGSPICTEHYCTALVNPLSHCFKITQTRICET